MNIWKIRAYCDEVDPLINLIIETLNRITNKKYVELGRLAHSIMSASNIDRYDIRLVCDDSNGELCIWCRLKG